MDQIDINLFDAWNRIGSALKANPARALQRWQTRIHNHSTRLFRPERSWCLCLRASDHRINSTSTLIDPPDALDLFFDHSVTITGSLIRQLTQPVNIPWPGVTTNVAARISIGIHHPPRRAGCDTQGAMRGIAVTPRRSA